MIKTIFLKVLLLLPLLACNGNKANVDQSGANAGRDIIANVNQFNINQYNTFSLSFYFIVGFILFALYLSRMFREDRNRESALSINQNWTGLYRNAMNKILEVLENFYGGLFSFKAFSMSYTLSLFYTLILFIILWSLGGSGKIGEMDVFPENIEAWKRLVTLLTLGVMSFIVYKVFKNDDEYQDKINHFIQKRLSFLSLSQSEYLFKSLVAGLGFILVYFYIGDNTFLSSAYISVLLFFYPVVGVVGVVGIVVAALVVVQKGVAIGVAVLVGIVAVGAKRVVIVVIVVGGGGVLQEEGVSGFFDNNTASFLFFLIILPFLNSIFDYFSMGVSRILLKKAISEKSRYQWLGHILIDLILAFVFMFALTVCIVGGTEYYNHLIKSINPSLKAFQVDQYILDASTAPFGVNGFWVTFMLLSTLIPTFLHLVFVLFLFLLSLLERAFPLFTQLIRENKSDFHLIGASVYIVFIFLIAAGVVFFVSYLAFDLVSIHGTTLSSLLHKTAVYVLSLVRGGV